MKEKSGQKSSSTRNKQKRSSRGKVSSSSRASKLKGSKSGDPSFMTRADNVLGYMREYFEGGRLHKQRTGDEYNFRRERRRGGGRGSNWDELLPTVVRILCFATGVTLCGTAAYSLFPLVTEVKDITNFVVKCYLCLFGASIAIIEGKTLLYFDHTGFRRWFYSEFKCLTHLRGKALYYYFVSFLCFPYWQSSYLYLAVGILLFIFATLFAVISYFGDNDDDVTQPTGINVKDFRTTTRVPSFGPGDDDQHQFSPMTSPFGVDDESIDYSVDIDTPVYTSPGHHYRNDYYYHHRDYMPLQATAAAGAAVFDHHNASGDPAEGRKLLSRSPITSAPPIRATEHRRESSLPSTSGGVLYDVHREVNGHIGVPISMLSTPRRASDRFDASGSERRVLPPSSAPPPPPMSEQISFGGGGISSARPKYDSELRTEYYSRAYRPPVMSNDHPRMMPEAASNSNMNYYLDKFTYKFDQ